MGAATTGGLGYINFERLISVPIFLLLLAGIFFIITKVIGSTNKKIVKKSYRPQSDSNINIKKINTKNESTKKVSDQIENILKHIKVFKDSINSVKQSILHHLLLEGVQLQYFWVYII